MACCLWAATAHALTWYISMMPKGLDEDELKTGHVFRIVNVR